MNCRLVAFTAAAVVLAAACTSGGGTPSGPTSASPTASSSPSTTVTALPTSLVTFGSYTAVPLADPDSPAYAGPATPTSLTGVQVAPSVRQALGQPGVTAALTAQGVVVVPGDLRQLHFAYTESRYGGWPVYVSTDAAYHIWHLTFDKVLRSLEEQVLLPKLRTLVGQSLDAASKQTTELSGTPLADAAARAEQLYQVAAAELGLPVQLGPLARQEKALVDAHAGIETSPILGNRIDYSLTTPRGHYTRSAALSRYFVAMSVLGQSAFCLPGTLDCNPSEPALPMRVGLLASRVLLASADRVALWQEVYEPTAFLVGLADDYTPAELAEAAKAVTPQGLSAPTVFSDDATLTALVTALRQIRAVRIDPERASVRLMGTRFVLDSFMMDQLIYANVGEDPSGEKRLLPSALDVAAALGSETALAALEKSGATAYQGYSKQLSTVRALVSERPPADWGGTVYDAWLYALEPVLARHGTAFPAVMRTPAWAAKALQSGLGSYAQLKHDTILYAKQAVAEGGGEDQNAARRNWVEPEPVAFARLAAAVDLLRTGLTSRKLATAEQTTLLGDVSGLFGFFARIATDELAGTPIKDADNTRLTDIGDEFEALWFRTSDQAGDGMPEADTDSALIADIASGPGQVLEVGTGRFDRLYVPVPNDQGTFQVAVGAVFSYYEFAGPAGQRLTDETWRARLDAGQAPERPSWQTVMFPR